MFIGELVFYWWTWVQQQARGVGSTSDPSTCDKRALGGDEEERGAVIGAAAHPIAQGQLARVQPRQTEQTAAGLGIPEHPALGITGHGLGYGMDEHIGCVVTSL